MPTAPSPVADCHQDEQAQRKENQRGGGDDAIDDEAGPPSSPRPRPKSTTHDATLESGRISRGKNTLEINWALPTRQPLTLVSTLLKKFQPSRPANENTRYGTPPLGNFATMPNTKENTPAASSGCRDHPDDPQGRLFVA